MQTLSHLETSQPRAVGVLASALDSDRLHHAYLLVGPEEAGGIELARAVAKALVCSGRSGLDSCGSCAGCRKLEGGNHPDVLSLSPNEKGSIPIDAVRDLSNRLALRASEAGCKVAIIERADAMAPVAQNALLKTLEEPPGPTCFLLITGRARSLLPTVRSRCQTLRLASLRRADAWKALCEAGIDEELAQRLAALVGPDFERAQRLVDLGAAEIVAALDRALDEGATPSTLLQVAADLGADQERTALAVAFLEIDLRDGLARARGAKSEQLYVPKGQGNSSSTKHPRHHLARAAARLQELRRLQALHVNRVLALESIFLTLHGHLPPGVASAAGDEG